MRIVTLLIAYPSAIAIQMDLAPGDRVGPYTIVGQLGRGGMGQVVLAHDPRLQRNVALKRLIEDTDPGAHGRILTEARAAAQITHPNVAAIHDVIEHDSHAFIVMEYVEGESLERRLASGRFAFDEVVSIAKQLAAGLAAAHARGVVHRDLKPSNIQVTAGGSIKILDFGVARAEAAAAQTLTSGVTKTQDSRVLAGTPPYMSPEQLLGRKTDERSDLYSLGVVLYELAVGRRPFDERQSLELVLAMAQTDPPSAHAVDPTVPLWFSRILARLLSRDPKTRFQSAPSVLDALELQTDAADSAVPRGATRRTWLAAAAILLVAALAAIATPAGRRLFTPATAPAVIAVLPVDNPTRDPLAETTAAGIDARVMSFLRRVPGVTLIPRAATASFGRRREDLGAMQSGLNATLVIDLKLTAIEPQLHLAARVRSVDRSPDVWNHVLIGDQLAVERLLLEGLGGALRTAYMIVASEEELAGLQKLPTSNGEALREYTQARSLISRPEVPGNLTKALDLLKSAIARDAGFGLAHAELAIAHAVQYQRTSDPAIAAAATQTANDALRLAPNEGRPYYALGYLQNVTGRRQDAAQSLRRAAELQPEADEAHRLLGFILSGQGDTAGAVAAAQQAIAIRPQDWNNHFTLGRIYYDAGQYQAAVEEFRRVTELEPSMPRGYLMLGASFHRLHDLTQAAGNYEHAVRLGPNAGAYSNLGVIYFTAGRFEDAIRAYETAIEHDPSSPTLRSNLGEAYRKAAQSGKARAAYVACVDLGNRQLVANPRRAAVIAAIALCEAKLGRHQDAERHGLEALALAPTDRDVLYKNAAIAALMNNRSLALDRLRAAVQQGYPSQFLRDDDDFASVRGSPEFERLIAQSK